MSQLLINDYLNDLATLKRVCLTAKLSLGWQSLPNAKRQVHIRLSPQRSR